MKALEWSQHFSHYKSRRIFCDPQGQLSLQSEVGSARNSNSSKLSWLSSLIPAKNEEDPIEKESARVVTTLYINFSDAQGQITPRLGWGLAEI